MRIIELLVIDPQNDFCDPQGSLFVKGADEDMTRLAKFVDQFGSKLSDINVTFDSHQDIDIAHPYFWVNSKGENPKPFTIIHAADVDAGTWLPAVPSKSRRDRAVAYVKQLEPNGRYPLCIWPVHCVIGEWGHNVYKPLQDSLRNWSRKNFATINPVTKGSNPWTEHYSAVKAEVPDPQDESTRLNKAFIAKLQKCDEIIIAGEALSHCVANTVRDVAEAFGDDSYVQKLVLLTDASSNVTGFENFGDQFLKDMTARGMRTTTTKDYVAA